MSKSKLTPCPFCGCGEEYVAVIPHRTMIAKKDIRNVYQIICTKCGTKTGRRNQNRQQEDRKRSGRSMEQEDGK